MGNVSFTIEEENLICIYHKHDRRRTIVLHDELRRDMLFCRFVLDKGF